MLLSFPFAAHISFFMGKTLFIYLFSLFTGEVYYRDLNEEGFCFIHKSRQKACIVNVSTVTKRYEKCNTHNVPQSTLQLHNQY